MTNQNGHRPVSASADTITVTAGEHSAQLRRRLASGRRELIIDTGIALGGDPSDPGRTPGAWLIATKVHWIVSWAGPELDGVPISADAIIDVLPPDLGRAITEQIEAISAEGAIDPKSTTASIEAGIKAAA